MISTRAFARLTNDAVENRIATRKQNRLEKRASAALDAKQKRKWNQL